MRLTTPNPLKQPVIAVVGPTASGKSELAVLLAKRFKGEIISCDSRQVYRGMDIGTGKVTGFWQPNPGHPERSEGSHPERSAKRGVEGSRPDNSKSSIRNPQFVYKGIPHHCIDFISPRRQYSVAMFKRDAEKAIRDIVSRGKLPILCGGTGHWADAVVFNQQLPEVKPNPDLRNKLVSKTVDQLFSQLQKHDPARAATIDRHNKRRLVRALEIVITTGKPVPPPEIRNPQSAMFNCFFIGITWPQEILYERIDKRLLERLENGMVEEVRRLHEEGLSWKRLLDFGLEYRFISLFLQGKLSYEEMVQQLSYAIKHYAKRQMTWFKRNKDIHWITSLTEASKLTRRFLT